MANVRTCTHIKVTGVRCGSPALRGEQYCYFHYRMLCDSRVSHVALLENEEAIQVSLMEVVNSLLRGTMDVKRGELVLRALNTAVRNSRRVRFENRSEMVRVLPKDPVVQPRVQVPSAAEVAARKQEMIAEYFGTEGKPDADVPTLRNPRRVGQPAAAENAADRYVRSARTAEGGRPHTSGPDPAQRKPPAAVKESAAPQELALSESRASARESRRERKG